MSNPDTWLQDGPLLYRVTDDRHPVNRDEISVTMADGSRDLGARTKRASELLASLAPTEAAAMAATVPHEKLTHEIDMVLTDPDTKLSPGAVRALQWCRTWVSVPLQLAQAPVAGQPAEPSPRLAALEEAAQEMDSLFRTYRDAGDERMNMYADAGARIRYLKNRAAPKGDSNG